MEPAVRAVARALRLSRHACTPETPREKGSVEGAVRHHKTGFWPARRFGSLPELDEVYADWRDRIALPRRHATGGHIVAERLAHEREALRALPPVAFDAAGRRSSRVPLDGYLKHGRLLLPRAGELVHQRVELRWDRDRVWIEHRGQHRRGLRAQLRARHLAARAADAPRTAAVATLIAIAAPAIIPPALSDYAELCA